MTWEAAQALEKRIRAERADVAVKHIGYDGEWYLKVGKKIRDPGEPAYTPYQMGRHHFIYTEADWLNARRAIG